MSRNLVINTQRKWTPSPELAIREEEGDEDAHPIHKQRLIEEVDEEDDEDQDDHDHEEDDDEEEDEEEEEEEEDGSDFTSSPSIPDENINFDLVYTLHTFEATVDGQATVKKGDALTLLDDSNSYWWLIRDLKTSEVGYIPAENIETPFERLARLNKHRNVELTSMDQAAHYISNKAAPNAPLAKNKKNKRVVLSTSLNVQLHVLLTGEDDNDIEEETYEEWSEEMLDDDDDDDDDMEEPLTDKQPQQQQQQQLVQAQEEEDDDDNKPLQQAVAVHKSSQILDSKNSVHGHDETKPKQHTRIQVNNHAAGHPSREQQSKVLRVFAGNVDVGASYHSVRVTESTSVDELLMSAMEKFHISQIETKNGRSHGKNSGVEYYLTVKSRDGDEITLDPEDKPYAIHESLTAHLTTPMPSLTQFRQLVPSSADYANKRKKKRSASISSLSDSSLQFFLHKRIKRVNDKSGQVHIKVSLMTAVASTTATATTTSDTMAAIKKMTTLRRFGKKKKTKQDKAEMERIDKVIAIPANISIADLTSTALVKFHIIADIEQPHQYRLILNTNGKDTLLNLDQKLSDVLKDLEATAREKHFVLHNFSTTLDDQRPVSLSSSTSSSSSSSARPTSSKVFPEKHPPHRMYSHHSHPVMTRLDSNTEAILKRVDAALEAFEPIHNNNNNNTIPRKDIANPNFPSPMSVSRNEGGVDIHLPHGVLRSTPLSEKQTQYSLMKNPNTLVLQRVLPVDKSTAVRKVAATEKHAISGEEMATLVKYGSQYLDAYDTANSATSPTSAASAATTAAASSRLFVERDGGKSLSSLEDLEKELHRIITSHSS
ncbi:hypothetical protein MBANPS3_009680 [Mucor bainieri]